MRKIRIMAVAAMAALTIVAAAPALANSLPVPRSDNAEAQKLIDEAWALYKKSSTTETYKQCYEKLEKANQLDPNNHMILTELSRYYWNYGDTLPKDTDAQKDKLEEIYEKGMGYAEQSLDIKETAAGHYWYAVNKAASLEFSSILTQAAAFPSILSHSDKVAEMDADYYYGASGRLWTEILVRVPKKVVEMVNYPVEDVIGDIDTAIGKNPNFVDNYVYKARFTYRYYEKDQEALELIEKAMSIDPKSMPDEVNANNHAQVKAKELWKEITGKEYPNK